jgi:serine protease Do
MSRYLGIGLFCMSGLLWLDASPVLGQEKSGRALLLALEESFQDIIKKTEPSVACVLVTRNTIYRERWHDSPPADQPGKLGAFDPAGKDAPPLPNAIPVRGRGRGWDRDQQNSARRFDLSSSAYVPESYGSGLVVDAEAMLILTPFHVIRDATKIYVRLPGDKGSYADIFAADPRSDLAVLKVLDEKVKPLKAVKFGDGDGLQKGQIVVAIANPFAAGFRDGSPSASWGMISNLHRRPAATPRERPPQAGFEADQGPPVTVGPMIETDVRLHAGCSGGALVNLKGEVIGLTSSRAGVTGLESAGGFAIPIDKVAKRVIEQLSKGVEVEHGFLGIRQADFGADEGGVRIGGLQTGGPAKQAGLMTGNYIVAVNGAPVRTFDDLVWNISTLLAGADARLEIRERNPSVVTVTLAKAHVPGVIATNRPAPVRGIRVDYASVFVQQHADEIEQQARNTGDLENGVFVSEVAPSSPADNARISVNDMIVQVNGANVSTPAEFYREAAKVRTGQPLILTLASNDWNKARTTVTIP